jgi:hypothetical protein
MAISCPGEGLEAAQFALPLGAVAGLIKSKNSDAPAVLREDRRGLEPLRSSVPLDTVTP